MTLKRTMVIPASVVDTGERTYVFAFDKIEDGGILEGTLIKFRIESPGIVRLFTGVVRFRPLGCFFDGSQGEIWETIPMNLS